VRVTRAYLAGLGTAGSLVSCAALLFVLAGALLSYNGWPRVASASGPSTQRVVVSAPASAPPNVVAPETTVTVSASSLRAPVAGAERPSRAAARSTARSAAAAAAAAGHRRTSLSATAGGSGTQLGRGSSSPSSTGASGTTTCASPCPRGGASSSAATQTAIPAPTQGSSSGSSAGASNNNLGTSALGDVAGTVTELLGGGDGSGGQGGQGGSGGSGAPSGTSAPSGSSAPSAPSGSSSGPLSTLTAVEGQTVTAAIAAATGTIAGLTSPLRPAE
jgi:hypothetical protein